MRRLLVVLVTACAAAPPHAPGPARDTPDLPASTERHYAIWLGGAQVGTAHEIERWSPAGVTLTRSEAMRFLRGDVPVAIATTIEITADRTLVPSRVIWTERAQTTRHGEAIRDATGWTVRDAVGLDHAGPGTASRDHTGNATASNATRSALTGTGSTRSGNGVGNATGNAVRRSGTGTATAGNASLHRLPAAAIPAELAPLVVRRDGRFAGTVFLPARGFVAGTGRIEPVAARRLVARLMIAASPAARATDEDTAGADANTASRTADTAAAAAQSSATAEATIDLGDDAMPIRVVDGDGVIATRITAAEAAIAFAPVDLIAATSIPLEGSNRAPARRLIVSCDLAIPPVPGQSSQVATDGVELVLSPSFGGGLPSGPPGADRTREIAALVTRVHRRIAPDLGAAPAAPRAAAAAASGDCTTFALAYAARAAERAIPTRLVTGFRIDGDRLVRHRWAISWTGRAWIAVDAAFGAVPAGGDLIGVAVHDADDIGLIAGDAALTHVHSAAWR